MTSAYPLTWPEGFPRAAGRQSGAFKTSLAGALRNVRDSLRRFGADSAKPVTSVVMSSNVTLGDEKPADPGVAVWFTWEGMQVCIPVDRYNAVEANLQAIHHILEARRTELRHGGLAIVRATFTGFKALPPPADARPWHVVLELSASATKAEIDAAYRAKSKTAHPNAGGSREAWDRLSRAYQQAKEAAG